MRWPGFIYVLLIGLMASTGVQAQASGQPFALERVAFRLPLDSVVVSRIGSFCAKEGEITWDRAQVGPDKMKEGIIANAKLVGFSLESDPDELFGDANQGKSEYVLGALVTQLNADICFQRPNRVAEFLSETRSSTMKGTSRLGIEWQVYSRLERKVVAKITTQGAGSVTVPERDGLAVLLNMAIIENLKALVSSAEYRAIYARRPRDPAEVLKPTVQAPLTFKGAPAIARKVGDTIPAVALVLTGTGHGSGFLVSSDGHLISNAHVVGGAKFVKVRWADGTETLGEVLRSDRRRDVALIKADPFGRRPLAIRRSRSDQGEAVYAVGAPLDVSFQSTVTRGVVSAHRTLDGLAYLQSDVNVNPGNSGGPLLDEKGAVVAVTVAGINGPDGASANINLFIPIDDALRYLGVTLR